MTQNGQGSIYSNQTARQCGHDRPHRPRQDHADRRDLGRPGGEGAGQDQVLRRYRQGRHGARRDQDRDDRGGPRRVRNRQAPLRPHRLSGPRRLHQEHDHRRRPDGRGDSGGFGGRRPDAANPRARAPGPPGERARPGRVPQQGRPGRRSRVAGTGRTGTPRVADPLRFPGRRNPHHPRRLAVGLQQARRSGGQQVHRRAAGRHRRLYSRAARARSTSRS